MGRKILGCIFCISLFSTSFVAPSHSETFAASPLTETSQIIRSHFYDIEKLTYNPKSPQLGTFHFVSVIEENLFLAVINKNSLDTSLVVINTLEDQRGFNVVKNFNLQEYFASKLTVVTDVENMEFPTLNSEVGTTYLAVGIEGFPTNKFPTGYRQQIVVALSINIALNEVTQVNRVFETEPIPNELGVPLALSQVGGRIALTGKITLTKPNFYLSIGDYAYSSAQRLKLPMNIQKSLGTVIQVKNGRSSVFTSGHRNPQGLTLARLGREYKLIETEHGPRGGDELNLLVRGRNYGWPDSSYGTAYDTVQTYSKARSEGFISSGNFPAFAWVPSIATSDLVQISGSSFGRWWGREGGGTSPVTSNDLLVATLKDKSLHRIRIEAGVVKYTERIPIGYRIRSITETKSGKIILGTDNGPMIILAPFSQWDLSTENYIPLRAISAMDLVDANWFHGVGKSMPEILISSVDKDYSKIKIGGKIVFENGDSRTITNLTTEGSILRVTFAGETISSEIAGFPKQLIFEP